MIRPLLALALVLAFGWGAAVPAEERSSLWPAVPQATGQAHAEGNEYWRRNHMDLMRHDRDLTLREGDRRIGASLKGCFDCHAARDAAGQVVSYASEQHFCRSCHDFAAVKVDCFTCHRSTPEGVDETAAHAAILPAGRIGTAAPGELLAWLARLDGRRASEEAAQ